MIDIILERRRKKGGERRTGFVLDRRNHELQHAACFRGTFAPALVFLFIFFVVTPEYYVFAGPDVDPVASHVWRCWSHCHLHFDLYRESVFTVSVSDRSGYERYVKFVFTSIKHRNTD